MGHLLPEYLHQAGQFHEVLQTERRTAGRDRYDRIRLNPVRPAGRNRDQLPLRVPVIEKFLAPVLSDGYDGKLLAAVGMEGMDDAEHSIAIARTGRS